MNDCRHCTPCALERIEGALLRLENAMATAKEQIEQLSTKVDGISAVTADIAGDFRAFKAAMEAERENLTADGQAALDAANAKLDAAVTSLADLDVAVGDADGSDVVVPPADEPAPVDESAPPAGEGSDLSVDTTVSPEDPDAPRPTGAEA